MFEYDRPLIKGKLVKRYKRFLVDVILDDGRTVTAHCTNTGSLKSCLVPGAEVWLSPATDPSRKTPFTWESIRIGDTWVGVNTQIPNRLIYNALLQGKLKEFAGFTTVKKEVKYGNSRFDIYLENENERLFAEIKNVTYREGDAALFPDAPTVRGRKHLEELIHAVKKGYRAAMIFIIGRTDVKYFAPARDIDPDYADLLKRAVESGVEIYPYMVEYSSAGAHIKNLIPLRWE